MITVNIVKLQSTGHKCAGKNCKKNPDYLYNILGHVYHLKTDTTVAEVILTGGEGGWIEYYCRDCIDDLYAYFKSTLDSKLWIFH